MLGTRQMRIHEKTTILEIGKLIFREEDEIPLLIKAINQCVPELSFVAVDDNDKIVGFTLVCTEMTECYYKFMRSISNCYELAFLGINPKFQGYGLGTRLLKETLLAIFQRSNSFRCWLLVDTININAIKLYKRIGFKEWRKTDKGKTLLPGYIMGMSRHQYTTRRRNNSILETSLK
jgi:ribosomal protein S18 acetylase RimI-like enzyme